MTDEFKARLTRLSPQQLTLLALDLRARLDRIEDARRESIAIVGVGCRFPGADNPDAFWRLLADGRDAVTEIPAERWNADEFFDADPDRLGTMATRWGGFLQGVDRFDAEFFGIAPREACSLDPQQRLLLECTWEALEHAGIAPDRLRGSRTGVFIGISTGDYYQLMSDGGHEAYDAYAATGAARSVASGRLSYVLGLEGPAVSIDTACSSALMAVHLAVRSIRSGECRAAIAGGVNLILWPGNSIAMSRARMMAPDGRCKAFDSRADGFVRSEGCGVIVLKRLSDAVADGDRVLALIRGSAANQDGRSNGLTAPSGRAQAAVVTEALADAGVSPAAVSYVEAHGTGTSLGDPIELHALGSALSPGRDAQDRVLVGSVKSNLGHLEAAAGMAGLIKTVLMLRAGQIAPSLHVQQPNPLVDWNGIPIDVATSLRDWEPRSGRRIAGVSSFGVSGSNAHIILEAAPQPEAAPAQPDRPVHVFTLSARTAPALRELARRHDAALEHDAELSAGDVCYTAAVGRTHLECRAAFVVRDRDHLQEQLRAIAADRVDATVLSGELTSNEAPRVAFLFTGQGAQYAGMSAHLARTEPVFRTALERCAAVLDPLLSSPLIETMHAPDISDRRIHDTPFTQPATLALQFALAELWRSWGVVPSAVMGHSLGEYAAACIAGVMPIEDGLQLVAARARLMQSAAGGGAMLSVFAHGDVVRDYLAAAPSVSVAAFNGPDNTVISGPRVDVARVEAALVRAGIEVRQLEISLSSHSAMVEPVLDEFERVASRVKFAAPQLPVISNLSGAVADASIATPAYWRRHLREPVRFGDGISTLVSLGTRVFLEIGPHPSLISMARRYTTGPGLQWLASLRRDREDNDQIAETLGALYVQGVPVDWTGYAGARGARKVALPTYAFERTRCWIDVKPARPKSPAIAATGLPGKRIDTARGPVLFDGEIGLQDMPWLASHRVGGAIIAPGPLFVDIARVVGSAVHGIQNAELVDFEITAPLTVPQTASRRVQTSVERDANGAIIVEIASQDAGGRWTMHARGQVREANATWPSADRNAQDRCPAATEVASHYARLEAAGAEFGPDCRRLTRLARGAEEAVASASVIAPGSGASPLHPAVVDGYLHAVGACFPDSVDDAYLMTGADRIVFAGAAPEGVVDVSVHARLRPADSAATQERVADVFVTSATGAPVAWLDGIRLRRTRRQSRVNQDIAEPLRWTYELQWVAAPAGDVAPVAAGQRWLLVGGPAGLRAAMADAIERAGGIALPIDPVGDGGGDVEARTTQALDLAAGNGAPTHVVHLDAAVAAGDEQSVAALRARVERICRGALALTKTLIAFEWPARLWLVTAGATPPTGVQDVAGGALWGFGRTFGNEHPELWGGTVDLDAAPDADRARDLLKLITAGIDEPAVAIVAGARLVARVARVTRAAADADALREPGLRADATYVVTGAFGGIGGHVARWLVERGVRHLALLVRRAATEDHERELGRLRRMGADVRLFRADVAVESEVVSALDAVRAAMPRIAGVLHVAGTFNDAVIERMDWPRFASVLSTKVDAGWHLHQHTLNDALDHFVLFASGGSVLGPVGLCNYAAANAGLDALAHFRRAQGRPAVSIDWGPWANTGMAEVVGSGRHGQWAQAGFAQMSPADSLSVLGDLMAPGAPAQALVVAVDWPVFRTSATGRGPLFSVVAPASTEPSSVARATAATLAATAFDLAAFSAARPEERRDRLVRFLRDEIAREIGVAADRIPLARPLTSLGLDSLMAVQVRNRVQQAVRTTIPVSRLIDGSSLAQLADELVDRLSRQTPATEPVFPAGGSSPIAVDSLSDSEVERMLLTLLAEQGGAA